MAAFQAENNDFKPVSHRSIGDPDARPIKPSKGDGMGGGPSMGGARDLSTEPDELTGANKAEAGCLVSLFGEKPVACIFSKAWNLKVEGTKKLADLICGLKSQKGEAFYRYCYCLRHRVAEEHKAVFTAAIEGVRQCGDKLELPTPEFYKGVSQVLPPLQSKIGCSQQVLSKITGKFLRWVCEKGCPELVIPMLLKHSNKPQNWKVPLAQIKTLHKIILAKGDYQSLPGLTLDSIMGLIVPNLESASKEVREAAMEFIVTMELLAGSVIYHYLEKVNSRVRETIDEKIKASKEALE